MEPMTTSSTSTVSKLRASKYWNKHQHNR